MGGIEIERRQKFMPEKRFAFVEMNSQINSMNQNGLSLYILNNYNYL